MTNKRYNDYKESGDDMESKARIGDGAKSVDKEKEGRSSLPSKYINCIIE